MAKKLGDVAIALVVLVFVMGAFSVFISQSDASLGVSSEQLGSALTTLEENLTSVRTFESSLIQNVDNTSTFIVSENTLVETGGRATTGLMNFLPKNILTRFLTQIMREIPESTTIIIFFLSLIAVTITILFLRSLLGENKW